MRHGQTFGPGDQELVTSANALMMCCQEMISAATDSRPASDTASRVRRVIQGDMWTPEMIERIEIAQKALAQARKDLTVLARQKLGRSIVDPFS
jgi:hypothetical protein